MNDGGCSKTIVLPDLRFFMDSMSACIVSGFLLQPPVLMSATPAFVFPDTAGVQVKRAGFVHSATLIF
jgi:hypothetical protein